MSNSNAFLGGDVQKVMLYWTEVFTCPHTCKVLMGITLEISSSSVCSRTVICLQEPLVTYSLISGVAVWPLLHVLTETSDRSLARVSLPQASSPCPTTSTSPGPLVS